MPLSHARAVSIGETPYPHETAAINFAREALPDRDPYHLWALVDLLDPSTGRLLELDLLVLGYSALYLVECKSGPGLYTGDSHDWWRTPPGGEPRYLENPRRLTQRKAQILKSRLQHKLPADIRAPWIEPLVFLANDDVKLRLTDGGQVGVVTQASFLRAFTHHEFPGSPADWRQPAIDRPTMRAVVRALEQVGFKRRKGKLHVGPYELGSILDETDTFQDRDAHHRDIKSQRRRARTYLVPEQTSVERRQQLRRAADREAQLLYEVREHPGILTFTEYLTDAPLGPTVLLDAFDGGVPLDAFLREHADLPFADRLSLIEQIGRALAYCHGKEVLHGALSPSAVLVRRAGDSLETRLFDFQLGQSEAVEATSHWSALAAESWSLYQAPELQADPALRSRQSDLYSLGALAHLILTGKPPGATLVDVATRLRDHRCLDPRHVADDLPEAVAEAIVLATDIALAARADDVGQWLEILLDNATAPPVVATPEPSPLEARKEEQLGNLKVVRVLGHGASSRVLEVERDDGRRFALKVSIAPEHDERLAAEAALLARLRHPRIVVLEAELRFAGRPCLLLSLAGDRTLHRELSEKGTVSLDYAQRYGVDLLDALAYLEEEEVVHRDLKPANVGIGTARRQASSLTLFDFSLAATDPTVLGVGTAAYRDPFLPARGRWDHAADRYSAAVMLHELLTGQRPRLTAPIDDPAAALQIAAERLDPSVRATLAAFFTRAFARDTAARFDGAAAMRKEWERAFEGERPTAAVPVSGPAPADDDAGPAPLTEAELAEIVADTPIAALRLTTRAKNALDRAGVLRAADLLALPRNRLSGIRGVGSLVAKEIHALREALAARAVPIDAAPFFPGYRGDDLLCPTALATHSAAVLADAGLHSLAAVAAAPARQIEALAGRGLDTAALRARLAEENQRADEKSRPTTLAGWIAALFPARKKTSQHVRALFGLEGPLAGRADIGPRDLAAALDMTPAAIYIALGKARDSWAGRPALPTLIVRLRELVTAEGGAAPVSRLAAALLAELPHEPDPDGPSPLLLASALCRAAAEVDKDEPAGLRPVRLHDAIWLTQADDLADAARRLGQVADELADREPLAGPAECARALAAAAADTPLAALPPDRLVRLAAAASKRALVSSRLELFPRGMPAHRALELSAAVLGPASDQVLIERVAARYPGAEPLPPRRALDALLEPYDLWWDGQAATYRRRGDASPTSLDTRLTSYNRLASAPREISAREVAVADFDDRVRAALERKSLLVLGVAADQAPAAVRALAARYRLVPRSFDRLFWDELARQMDRRGVAWDAVAQADAEGPGGEHWALLTSLARDVAAAVATALLPPREPLLLVDPGLIDRYQLTDFLHTLAAAAQRDDADAILVLVPDQGGGTPAIGGRTPVPGLLPGQATWVDGIWLKEAQSV
jgi:serine/threonine protein kinase